MVPREFALAAALAKPAEHGTGAEPPRRERRDEKHGEVIYDPRSVSGINNAIDVSVGESHACAMLSGGTLTCWGSSNGYGQLGDGTTNPHYAPVPVSFLDIYIDQMGLPGFCRKLAFICSIVHSHFS